MSKSARSTDLLDSRKNKGNEKNEQLFTTPQLVQHDLDALEKYKTADVDRLIRGNVKKNADASLLRAHVLTQQQFHRIYFYVSLEQIKNIDERMAFIHENLLFSDWWHTDELIGYVADLDFEAILKYAAEK